MFDKAATVLAVFVLVVVIMMGQEPQSGSVNVSQPFNPMTALGDLIYGTNNGIPTRLPGPTSQNGVTYTACETPASSQATAPGWCQAALVPNFRPIDEFKYRISATDMGNGGRVVCRNNAGCSWGLAQAGTSGYGNNGFFTVENQGSGILTLTARTSTFTIVYPGSIQKGKSSVSLTIGESALVYTDNLNYSAYVTK